MMVLRLLVLLATTLYSAHAFAVPRLSLVAGSPCATCHENPTGGGLRTLVGFETMHATAAVKWKSAESMSGRPIEQGLGNLLKGMTSNQLFDDRLSLGYDIRLQWAHLGRPRQTVDSSGNERIEIPPMRVIPMQMAPYARVHLTEWLKVYGGFNVGPKTFRGEACDPHFRGQQCFDAALQAKAAPGLTVRGGMIQPSIGIRHDDHTIMIRGDASDRQTPIIPANYAEWGGEVSYHPISWFRVEAGVFETSQLDEVLNDQRAKAGRTERGIDMLAYGGRITWLPQFRLGGSSTQAAGGSEVSDDFDDDFDDDFGDDFDDEASVAEPIAPVAPLMMNGWLGFSGYGSGEFYLLNAFAGLGTSQGLSFFAEMSHSDRESCHETWNGLFATNWALRDWFVLAARAEYGWTKRVPPPGRENGEYTTAQYVMGVEFFPLPLIEIRPEYRLVMADEYTFGQATVQLHLFY